MKTSVQIKLQVEGTHRWAGCNIEEVAYLRETHRHVFFITCEKEVRHSDRDIEIISFKRAVKEYMLARYFDDKRGLCTFGEMSCEMIAQELLQEFGLFMCSVLEDNENGARVTE